MLFQHSLIEDIVSGRKTQTRRPWGKDDFFFEGAVRRWKPSINNPSTAILRWRIGQDYAVQPGRGECGLHYGDLPMLTAIPDWATNDDPIRIQITDIRHEDVRDISEADARAEGFANRLEFWRVWTSIYDKPALKKIENIISRIGSTEDERNRVAHKSLFERPAARYGAWALTFEVVHP